MEVHHHSQHGGEKSWKKLLTEFIMLFLAVFSGFIAENLREHYVEKQRAHQYIVSMVNDLEKNTTHLQQTINVNKRRMKGIDSLLRALSSPPADSTDRDVYTYIRFVISDDIYISATNTITQLKNAGGFRLITDTMDVNTIMNYDQKNEDIRGQATVYTNNIVKIIDLTGEFLDFSVWNKSADKHTFFIDKDIARRRNFYNKCFIQQRLIENYINMLSAQKLRATTAIATLSKKI